MKKSTKATLLTIGMILLFIAILVAGAFFLPSCVFESKQAHIDGAKTEKDSLFTIIESNDELHFYIVYMNKTKVMYAISDGSENRGDFTLLVNADGSPMIYKEGLK